MRTDNLTPLDWKRLEEFRDRCKEAARALEAALEAQHENLRFDSWIRSDLRMARSELLQWADLADRAREENQRLPYALERP